MQKNFGNTAVAERTAYSILFTVSFCHLLNDSIGSMLPAIYPLLKSEMALSFAQIGAITLVYQLMSSLIQPLVGFYADRHHHSWQLSVGMFLTLMGIFLLADAKSFGVMLGAVALVGCGSAIFHPQGSQVAQAASGGQKGLAQSIFQVGGNAGFAIGPLLGAIIVLPHGMGSIRWFGILAIVCAMLLAYIGWWHVRELRVHRKLTRARWATERQYSRRRIRFFVFILFMLMFSKNFYSTSMTNFYTFFLMEKFGVGVRDAQLCLFAFLAAQAVGTIVGGMAGDRYGRKLVIWFSILGVAPFTLALPYIGTFAGVVGLSIVIGLIIASAFSAILVFATDLMPEHTGIVAGLFYGLSFGVSGIGGSLFGMLADHTSVEFVFRISTVLPLMGIIAVFLPKMKKG